MPLAKMFAKLATICILMFAIEAVLVFGNDVNVNAKELHGIEQLAEAVAASTPTITTTRTTTTATTTTTVAPTIITTTETPATIESKLKFESSSSSALAVESSTTTTTTTTKAAAAGAAIKTETITTPLASSATIKNDFSSEERQQEDEVAVVDIGRRTLSLNNATVKPEIVAVLTAVEELVESTSTSTSASASPTTTTTSTATPTTTATTSTTTTTMMTPHEVEELERAAEHAWQRLAQAQAQAQAQTQTSSSSSSSGSNTKNGNEASTNHKQQLAEHEAFIAGVAANSKEQNQQQQQQQQKQQAIATTAQAAPMATTKLIVPEADATETPVIVHATATATTTQQPTTLRNEENVNKKLIANDEDDVDEDEGEGFDVVATSTAVPISVATTTTAVPATTTSTTTATMTTTTDATPELLLPTINEFMQIESKSYQVPETLATDSDDGDGDEYVAGGNDNGRDADLAGRSKLNIVDLYPMKIEDFKPIIRDSNERLLKERTIFKQPPDAEEYRQNLMPNEVELLTQEVQQQQQQQQQQETKNSVNRATPTAMGETISDFTGKLLAEQDGVITEIEQKFRLNDEFQQSSAAATTTAVTPSLVTSASSGASATTTTSSEETTTIDVTASAAEVEVEAAAAATETTMTTTTTTTKVGGERVAASADTLPTPRAMQRDHRHTFIDRRVKKSFDFPMHRVASDVMAMPHIDFANTKFNTDVAHGSGGVSVGKGANQNGGMLGERQADGSKSGMASPAMHPEFSTTKFYNSKELYNEMLLHNKRKLMKASIEVEVETTPVPCSVSRDFDISLMKSNITAYLAKYGNSWPLSFTDSSDRIKLDSAEVPEALMRRRKTIPPTTPTTTSTMVTRSKTFGITTATAPIISDTTLKPKKYQKELKRAKLLLKAMLPTNAAAMSANTEMGATVKSTKPTTKPTKTTTDTEETSITKSVPAATAAATAEATTALKETSSSTIASLTLSQQQLPPLLSTTTTSAPYSSSSMAVSSSLSSATPVLSSSSLSSQRLILNPSKSASKPIARPRILSRLQEKINSLECEIQNVPQDSHLWRGNETHELLLPIVTTEHCRNLEQHMDCTPNVVSWEGEAEIQSGDILIVEINDAMLNPNEHENFTTSAHAAQVYQVTRSGHEHCDVTEGILLDITPLVVDGRKLVTLYDKDLTEGVNLLIVVSELWGTQCVRLKVTTKTDNCGENADCSGKGVCYSNTAMEEYECQCCSGFAGPHCEEIDACNPSPCTNNGICVDLSQGHEGNSYQCLCPYGYTGKNCQYESDPCNPAECMNGGSCVGNSTHFRCDCTPGYAGPLCQHSLNECESSPCVHGICVDQEDGFRCFCQPGFAGELCNFEYNECESNPCQNGGECIDHIGSYECRCSKGYTGNRCQIKVDFCANKPCPEGQRCIDHGNDFSCECPGGRNGPDCNQMPRTQCNVNPCTHGGTCWSSGDSFYCACRPGFTGTMCEDEFVVETVVSSSEFIVDDTSARNFNDKTFGSSVVLKSPIELHNAYFAAGVLAAAIFIVAIVVTICHCKVNQTYRKFSTRTTTFFPILGFSRRPKMQNKLNKHWLSGKGIGTGAGGVGGAGGSVGGNSTGSLLRSSTSATSSTSTRHLPQPNPAGGCNAQTSASAGTAAAANGRQLHERPFQRHLAMNLENDMYYTVDFSENSQHSPLIQ